MDMLLLGCKLYLLLDHVIRVDMSVASFDHTQGCAACKLLAQHPCFPMPRTRVVDSFMGDI